MAEPGSATVSVILQASHVVSLVPPSMQVALPLFPMCCACLAVWHYEENLYKWEEGSKQ